MAVKIESMCFPEVDSLRQLLGTLAIQQQLNTSGGPKYLIFSTKATVNGHATADADMGVDGICSSICGHMLTLAWMEEPLIDAALMYFQRNGSSADIAIKKSVMHPDGEQITTITVTDHRNKLIFKERGHMEHRYCELSYIRI